MSGRVVHFDIPADDVERATIFYASAFGWKLDPVPNTDYTIAYSTPSDEQGMPTEPGAINGGITKRGESLPHPSVTVDVPDIDATLARITELGGQTVVPKQPVMEMGFVAYFRDTEGNIGGLWETAKAPLQ